MVPKGEGAAGLSDRIRAEQIRMLYRTGPVGTVGATIGGFLLAWALQALGSSARLGTELWLGCLVLLVAGHLGLCVRFWRAAPTDAAWRPWAPWFVAFCFAEGALWGVASMAMATPGRVDHQLLVILVASIMRRVRSRRSAITFQLFTRCCFPPPSLTPSPASPARARSTTSLQF
jgi:hypothetical protein